MPRNVRNFWIELDVDGKKTKVATGPRSKDGGFTAKILMRENGSISERKVKITGYEREGVLTVAVDADGLETQVFTKR